MSLNRLILVSVVALLHVNAAIAQETTTQEPEVEALVAKLEAMEDAKTWPYEKLVSQADVVVIATFANRREIEYDLNKETEFVDRSTENISTLVSTMTLHGVIKGDVKGGTVDVIHFKWEKPIIDLGDWSFYEFRAKKNVPSYAKVVIDGEATGFSNAKIRTIKPEYLLFLKSRSDGRFEPVSGHRYAGYSVRVLND